MTSADQLQKLAAAISRWRKLHAYTGFVAACWLAVMAVSGVLLNHAEEWGLLEFEISNRFLPGGYTDEFHLDTTRANVVIADIHSGRFFGDAAKLISDAAAFALLISICSGIYSHLLLRRMRKLAKTKLPTS